MKGILKTYWITFPDNPNAPIGIGVTAYSMMDAWDLICERNYDHFYHGRYTIKENIAFADLDQKNVAPNIGPMRFRGIWYPCLNIGFGASGQR